MEQSITLRLQPATAKYADKKWQVTIPKTDSTPKRTIAFGAKGYTDYLISKDSQKKHQYLQRHNNESEFWQQGLFTNLYTPSYWSRYLLWEHPNIHDAVDEISSKMGIKVVYSKASADKYIRQLAKGL